MIKSFLVLFFICFPLLSASSELIWMNRVEIGSLKVSSGENDAMYYLTTAGGWKPASGYTVKATDCPNPAYATFSESQKGSNGLLSIILTAKTTKTPIVLVGICGYHKAYFEIKQVIY